MTILPIPREVPPSWAFVLLATVTLATAALSGCGKQDVAADAEQARLKGAIVIVIDTLRADHTSLHGYPLETTPTLERWARQGAMFERCYAPSSWTLPSVGMLFTGRYRAIKNSSIREDDYQMGSAFADEGFQTAAVLANPLLVQPPRSDFRHGFELATVYRVPKEQVGPPQSWTGPEVMDRALRFLRTRRDKRRPFLLYLHLYDPHHPYAPKGGSRFKPEADPALHAERLAALGPERADLLTPKVEGRIQTEIARYDSEIQIADESLALLEAELIAQGIWENTLIAVTSDHGEGLWQRARPEGEAHGPGHLFPELYQLHGAMLTDDQIHVPMVWRGPGVEPGQRRSEPVSLVDLMPTLSALCDLDPGFDPEFDGLDLFGASDALARRDVLYSHCSRGTSLLSDGHLRLHRPTEERAKRYGVKPELFDLQADPREVNALEDSAQRIGLEERLIAFYSELEERHTAEGADVPFAPDQRDILDLLGYTEEAHSEQQSADGAELGSEIER